MRNSTGALWILGAAVLASPTILAFFTGGIEVRAEAPAAVAAFALLGALALFGRWPLIEPSWPLAALGALAGLAVWTAVSVSWAPALGQAANDADRVVTYVALFALALVALREPAIRRWAPDALLTGIVVVTLYALAGRLLPDLADENKLQAAGDRLHQPITYWNALGLLTALGVILAVAVAGDESRSRAWRSAACAAAVPCGLACVLTFSRGALIAAVAGLVVTIVIRPRRPALAAAVIAVLTTAGLAAALQAFPAVLELHGGESKQAAQGRLLALVAVAAMAAAGLVFARLVHGPGAEATLPVGRRTRIAAAIAVPAAVVALGALVSFNTEQTTHLSGSASRVTTLRTNRGEYWRVALRAFAHHPVAGVGTGGFHVEWWRERKSDQFAFDAHSIYFETLGELGLVGGVLLLLFGASVVLGLRRRWRAAPDDPLLAAAAGVLAAYAAHAGLDWDWEVPAVTLVALVMAAAAIQRPRAA